MPKVTRYGSKALVNARLADYLVDWDRVVSRPQKLVKDFLYPFWKTHIVTEEQIIPGSRLRVDLLDWTTHTAIEVSPRGSHSFNEFFHGGSRIRFGAAMKRELGKSEWLEKNGFTLIEIFDEDFARLSPEWFREQGVEL